MEKTFCIIEYLLLSKTNNSNLLLHPAFNGAYVIYNILIPSSVLVEHKFIVEI